MWGIDVSRYARVVYEGYARQNWRGGGAWVDRSGRRGRVAVLESLMHRTLFGIVFPVRGRGQHSPTPSVPRPFIGTAPHQRDASRACIPGKAFADVRRADVK